MKRCILFLLVLWGSGCTPEKVEPPAAPNVEPVVSAFASPTGTLTVETAETLARDLTSILDVVELARSVWTEIDGANKGFEGKMEEEAEGTMSQALLRSEGLGVRTYPQVDASARGWIKLTYVCGPAESLASGGMGQIILNMVGEVGVVQSIVWGRFEQCQLGSNDSPTTLTGEVVMLPSSANEDNGTILVVAGDVTKGDSSQSIRLESRFRDSTIDVLRTVDDASFVILGPEPNSLSIGVQDSAGVWSCDFENTQCTGPMGNGDIQW